MTEINLRHVADFIVVVEHHAPVTGDAEVLKQHIAGENIGGGQLTNRVAVLFNCIAQLLTFDLLQPDIQRHHPSFDIQMANDNLIAKIGNFFRGFLQ